MSEVSVARTPAIRLRKRWESSSLEEFILVMRYEREEHCMQKMNKVRLVFAGLIAGVVVNVVEGVTNGAILGEQWKGWAAKLAPVTQQPMPRQGMLLWTILGFALGFAAVWFYVGVRPRFGA